MDRIDDVGRTRHSAISEWSATDIFSPWKRFTFTPKGEFVCGHLGPQIADRHRL